MKLGAGDHVDSHGARVVADHGREPGSVGTMPRVIDSRLSRWGGDLEDFEVGDVFRHWPGKTITEAEGHQFCLLTLAASPLHVDARFAREETGFGRNIVVGTFVYALLLGMSVRDISGRAVANLGVDELRHVAPLYYGDTLYGSTEVVGRRVSQSRDGTGILTVETIGHNQDDLVVCRFRRNVLLPRRDPASPGGPA